jgi:hypothetical protein
MLGGSEHAVRFGYQITDGHLGGPRLVLRAMTRKRAHAITEPMDMRRLLEWPDADHVVPARICSDLRINIVTATMLWTSPPR